MCERCCGDWRQLEGTLQQECCGLQRYYEPTVLLWGETQPGSGERTSPHDRSSKSACAASAHCCLAQPHHVTSSNVNQTAHEIIHPPHWETEE